MGLQSPFPDHQSEGIALALILAVSYVHDPRQLNLVPKVSDSPHNGGQEAGYPQSPASSHLIHDSQS